MLDKKEAMEGSASFCQAQLNWHEEIEQLESSEYLNTSLYLFLTALPRVKLTRNSTTQGLLMLSEWPIAYGSDHIQTLPS